MMNSYNSLVNNGSVYDPKMLKIAHGELSLKEHLNNYR